MNSHCSISQQPLKPVNVRFNPGCTFLHSSKCLICSSAEELMLVCAGLASLEAVGVARWTAQFSD